MGEAEEEVVAFLDKLKSLDPAIYNFQEDVLLNSMVVRSRMMDRSEALKLSKSKLRIFKGREPLKGLNVGDAKNLSHGDLERITNNFSDPIGRVGCGSLFRGFMNDGQEVTVKTWDFMFPAVYHCAGYPRDFHDEIVLLERSGLKSCPFFLKLVGFCFEKKLAIVYDLKFKKSLWLSFGSEFGWKERMRVATNYALLLKTLTMEKLDLVWSCDDIMIDEEYNIKLINYVVNRREGETCDGASVSGLSLQMGFASSYVSIPPSHSITLGTDVMEIEKGYIFEFGILLLELIMKRERSWHASYQLSPYIKEKGGSAFHETLEVDAVTSTEISKLIEPCVCMESAQRPDIESVISELKRIVGSG
ncbi:hypothetical protein CQW23_22202 [Capsicum baccatum]|uniref:Protein kinase domain-containing protein n=1 Tax=Capsicum baccatum TaxID=33114 RepID=A0A2G2W0B3_CAPBA|nr:hypothetical protein CQW23_22202 [Capsicum baccatum]